MKMLIGPCAGSTWANSSMTRARECGGLGFVPLRSWRIEMNPFLRDRHGCSHEGQTKTCNYSQGAGSSVQDAVSSFSLELVLHCDSRLFARVHPGSLAAVCGVAPLQGRSHRKQRVRAREPYRGVYNERLVHHRPS